jgi:hypothetical protein
MVFHKLTRILRVATVNFGEMLLKRSWTLVATLSLLTGFGCKIIFEKVDYKENPNYLTSILTISNDSGNSVINMDIELHKTWDIRLAVRETCEAVN